VRLLEASVQKKSLDLKKHFHKIDKHL